MQKTVFLAAIAGIVLLSGCVNFPGTLPEGAILCDPQPKGENIACTMIYQPVCGSDGKTHGNSCVACASENVLYYFEGECGPPKNPQLESCTSNNDCQQSSICYNSQICGEPPPGEPVSCGPQLGDLKCHQLCESDSECPSITPDCTEVHIWLGDAGLSRKICMGSQPEEPIDSMDECIDAGGFWRGHCGLIRDCCNFKTTDFGQACSDTTQCQGTCLVETPESTSGTCSQWKTQFGCYNYLYNGKVLAVCVD